MWPSNLNDIKRCGGMSSTELWMVKEQYDAGIIKIIKEPERVVGKSGRYYAIVGSEAGIYAICTNGLFGGSMLDNPDWCTVTRINRLTEKQASRLLSCYPYE
jgi:hypothetical protein